MTKHAVPASGRGWSVGKMLGFSFASVLLIVAVLSLSSFNGVSTLLSTSEELIVANETDAAMAQLEVDHLLWAQNLSFVFTDSAVNEVTVQKDPTLCNLGKWLVSEERERLEAGHPNTSGMIARMVPWHERLHQSAVEIDHHCKAGEANSEEAKAIFSKKSIPALRNLQGLLQDIREDVAKHSVTDEKLVAEAGEQRALIVVFVSVCVVASVCIAFLVTSKVKKMLVSTSRSIAQASEAVASAAQQVEKGSRSVAESSSEQASTLEETAAAMEEVSSQTSSNLEKAQKTGAYTTDTIGAIDETNQSLAELKEKITGLFDSSKEIQKVVQTIDEIAFQTNLLALNASVEAARAGEAGAGFSVVADEVRALAQRAASSAKETGEMIDESVVKIGESNEFVQRCSESFDHVLQTSTSVRSLVDQVVVASEEQSQGIGQINVSLVQMDKVVQSNASGAEESASAAVEMARLAGELEMQVHRLQRFAGESAQARTPKVELSAAAPVAFDDYPVRGRAASPTLASLN
ncbi:methyl-accepting chemotaxis protein [Pelagicoccus mobilis]|uniref:CZB domain-containing protein n=1 Tax=Pelagicoccus mobilis TaxID=415221 RepID=A0A934VRN7_9BACT|nr:methyl-accepting chemotaxis protein [Pelagicoccus mobilis]MBK1879592.1 CZB domain-containing protein [Pelagicoccus mobilis]